VKGGSYQYLDADTPVSYISFVCHGVVSLSSAIFWWHHLMLEEKPNYCNWLPEQQHVTVLLTALFCWINPLALVLFCYPRPPAGLLLASDLLHSSGYLTILLSWLCIIDGLKCYQGLKDRWLKAAGRSMGISAAAAPRAWPPKHHPRGGYFSDFIFPKLTYYALSLVVMASLCILRYPQIFFPDVGFMGNHSQDSDGVAPSMSIPHNRPHNPTSEPPPSLTTFRFYYAIISGVMFVIMTLWYLWVIRAAFTTGRALRLQPYMSTRSQQLSYRFCVQLISLMVLCKGIAIWLVSEHFISLLRGSMGMFWRVSDNLMALLDDTFP